MTGDEKMRELQFLAEALRLRRTGERVFDAVQRRLVTASLLFTKGNQAQAARLLGMGLKTMRLYARDYWLRPCDRKDS